MKKVFYILAVLATTAFLVTSCEEEATNPGDFNLKSEFKLVSLKSLVTGETYDLVVADERDTTYHYKRTVIEYLLDENGEKVLDSYNDPIIVDRYEEMVEGIGPRNKGHIVELAPIVIKKWTADDVGKADTFAVQVQSNAQWKLAGSTVTNAGGKDYSETNNINKYYANVGSTIAGSGDSKIKFECRYFSGNQVNVVQPIFTNDSSVVYFLKLQVQGKNFK